MNYFKPKTKYYIVDILSKGNEELEFYGTNIYEYVKETFPVLYDLEQERQNLLRMGIKQNSEDYRQHVKLMHFALRYLNLPRYLLASGDNDIFAIEPVTGNKIETMDKDVYTLEDRRVSDVNLENYYVSNYEEKARNFFEPTLETQRRAKLSIEHLAMIKVKQDIYNRKSVRILRKG
ncbi:MAG: hypothetical protein IJO43_00485 [Bacilli bacterium]|nr:hypothetical protein [Bacilli bacterium]